MTKPKYPKVLTLTEDDYNKTQILRARGVTIIGIYRAGLKVLLKTYKQETICQKNAM